LNPPPTPPQIARRRRAHQEAHPDAKIISLGIGDTTEPLPPYIANAMAKAAAGLATREGYSGCAALDFGAVGIDWLVAGSACLVAAAYRSNVCM